jgi:hypothetical protein
MADEIPGDVANLLTSMLSNRLWVVLAKVIGSQDAIAPHVADHLQWMNDMAMI